MKCEQCNKKVTKNEYKGSWLYACGCTSTEFHATPEAARMAWQTGRKTEIPAPVQMAMGTMLNAIDEMEGDVAFLGKGHKIMLGLIIEMHEWIRAEVCPTCSKPCDDCFMFSLIDAVSMAQLAMEACQPSGLMN